MARYKRRGQTPMRCVAWGGNGPIPGLEQSPHRRFASPPAVQRFRRRAPRSGSLLPPEDHTRGLLNEITDRWLVESLFPWDLCSDEPARLRPASGSQAGLRRSAPVRSTCCWWDVEQEAVLRDSGLLGAHSAFVLKYAARRKPTRENGQATHAPASSKLLPRQQKLQSQ